VIPENRRLVRAMGEVTGGNCKICGYVCMCEGILSCHEEDFVFLESIYVTARSYLKMVKRLLCERTTLCTMSLSE
jgi:hypothetical protein